MEVKIKNQNELIDATIEMVDGVMVVSPKKVEFEPKKVEFEPKDGDIVAVRDGKHIFINKDYRRCGTGYAYLGWNFVNDMIFKEGVWNYSRLATKEEKKLLFDKLAENGFEWDAEEKQLVKLKWKPKYKEFYFKITFEHAVIIPLRTCWTDDICDKAYYQKGWCFKTKEECQAFCDRLNESISSIKP